MQALSWYEMSKVTDLPDASLVNQVWALAIQILEILCATVLILQAGWITLLIQPQMLFCATILEAFKQLVRFNAR